MIVTLCSPKRFEDVARQCGQELERLGHVVLYPTFIPDALATKYPLSQGELDVLHAVHDQKILMSDCVYVINPFGYCGADTKREVDFANRNGRFTYAYTDYTTTQLSVLMDRKTQT